MDGTGDMRAAVCSEAKCNAYATHVSEKENIPVSSLLYKVCIHTKQHWCYKLARIHVSRRYPTIARIQLKTVISLLRVVPNIFTFVMAFSDHDIRFPSPSCADSFHVSWDRSLGLWVSLPSL